MTEYFIRRLLLAVPTFFISTLIVFGIVQGAPGGPLEQQLQQLKNQSAEQGGGTALGQAEIPPSEVAKLERYYHFHEPFFVRYLIWLGLWQRNELDFSVTIGEARKIGGGQRAVVEEPSPGQYRVLDANDRTKELDGWEVEMMVVEGEEPQPRLVKKAHAGILTFYFGESFQYNEPVGDLIADRFPVSFQFGLIGFILAYTVCIYMGILKALNHGGAFDFGTSVIVFVGYSIPGWALGAVMLVLFGGGSFLDIFPLGNFQSENYLELSFFDKFLDRAYHFVLPTIAYTIAQFATLTMLTKNSLLENLSKDYVRTAFAKGLREKRVVWVHALRNSLIPIASRIGGVIGLFVASSYLIELVFNIEGLGKLSFQAILARDYNIVFAFAVISVILLILGQMLSDLALSFVNPRIRFK